MTDNIKLALLIIVITASFASGYSISSWKSDSVDLAIEKTKSATAEIIASELSKQHQVTNIINKKVIERTRSESVYIDCKHTPSAEMVEIINEAIK